jgi:hypothetical protein
MVLTGKTVRFKNQPASGYAAADKVWINDEDLFICDGVAYQELSVRSSNGRIVFSNLSGTVVAYDGSAWTDPKYKKITFLAEVDEENSSNTQAELETWLEDNEFIIPKTGRGYKAYESQLTAIADEIRVKAGKNGPTGKNLLKPGTTDVAAEAGAKYYLSATINYSGSYMTPLAMRFLDANGDLLSSGTGGGLLPAPEEGTQTRVSMHKTAPEGAVTLQVTVQGEVNPTNVMVEKASSGPSTYEPYTQVMLEFPDDFVGEISGISTSNPVDEDLLVAFKNGAYKWSSQATQKSISQICTVANGVGTFYTSTSFSKATIYFIPLVDLYAYLNSAPNTKVELKAGTTCLYQFEYGNSVYCTYLSISGGAALLDSGELSYFNQIKIVKK